MFQAFFGLRDQQKDVPFFYEMSLVAAWLVNSNKTSKKWNISFILLLLAKWLCLYMALVKLIVGAFLVFNHINGQV